MVEQAEYRCNSFILLMLSLRFDQTRNGHSINSMAHSRIFRVKEHQPKAVVDTDDQQDCIKHVSSPFWVLVLPCHSPHQYSGLTGVDAMLLRPGMEPGG